MQVSAGAYAKLAVYGERAVKAAATALVEAVSHAGESLPVLWQAPEEPSEIATCIRHSDRDGFGVFLVD
jgi:hypothetical protein